MTKSRPIDYSKLYHLRESWADRPLRLERKHGWPSIQQASQLFGGEWQPPEPVALKAYMGGSPADFLWTGLPPLVCVSQRVIDLLEENRFSGWSTYPVEVYDRHGAMLPGYHGFAVTGGAGREDLSRSQIITKPAQTPTSKPYEVYKGLYFDESMWDGSDIFCVLGTSVIVVTQPVQAAFVRARENNVRFERLTEVETSVAMHRIIEKHRAKKDSS